MHSEETLGEFIIVIHISSTLFSNNAIQSEIEFYLNISNYNIFRNLGPTTLRGTVTWNDPGWWTMEQLSASPEHMRMNVRIRGYWDGANLSTFKAITVVQPLLFWDEGVIVPQYQLIICDNDPDGWHFDDAL